ncbi:MAG: hypothetical protein HS111_29040 [Kofleriaceae bacterium]|nr:hypothetical protein [Kofleriaceae bacterium]
MRRALAGNACWRACPGGFTDDAGNVGTREPELVTGDNTPPVIGSIAGRIHPDGLWYASAHRDRVTGDDARTIRRCATLHGSRSRIGDRRRLDRPAAGRCWW